jgi:hypothetical protein
VSRAALLTAALLVAAACTGGDGTGSPAAPIAPPGPAASAEQGATTASTVLDTVEGPAPNTGLTCWAAEPASGAGGIDLVDATAAFGLVEPLTGIYGHAAGWGDLDGDLLPDLVVGTFADKPLERYLERGATGPRPDTVLAGSGQAFSPTADLDGSLGRSSGVAMVDLDNDGDLDLAVSRNVADKERGDLPSAVYRNDGGSLQLVEAGIDPTLAGRSIGVLDYDHDGLADLLILEDHYQGANSRLYRNLGGLRFEDATTAAGLPDGIHGLGVATADVDRDGSTDMFVGGSNRLFLGTGSGFTEATLPVFGWETFGNEDDVAGAAFADVDLDGRLDLVVGHHFNSTVSRDTEVPVRLYLNRTDQPGSPVFEDVTAAAGLTPLPTKAPHVELADLDNDGLVDILTSASAADGTALAVFRNTGLVEGIPRFETPAGLGSDQYWVTAPTADVDRDGRLDVLAVEWYPHLPSILFHNESASGHWLEVSVAGDETPVGTTVAVYRSGQAGETSSLLGMREITATQGYTAGTELLAHFGLGDIDVVDVVVTRPGGDPVTESGLAVNRHVRLPGCGR